VGIESLEKPATWMLNYHTGVLQSSFTCDTHNCEKLSLADEKIRTMYNIGNTRF